jgi:hypothetical protein
MSKIVNFRAQEHRKPDNSEQSNSESDPREYSPDEVSDIIKQALQNVDNTSSDSVVHSELLAIAEEFGLGEKEIERAYSQLLDDRDLEQTREHLRFQFKLNCIFIAIVSLVIFAVDLFINSEILFAMYAVPGLVFTVIVGALVAKYLPDILPKMMEFSSSIETGSSPTFTTRKVHITRWGLFFYSGVSEEKGKLRIEGDTLLMEYRLVDGLFGTPKSKVVEKKIPLSEITGIELDRSYWLSKLTLKSKSLKTFEDVPGETDGCLKLTFMPRARVAIINLSREIEGRIANA